MSIKSDSHLMNDYSGKLFQLAWVLEISVVIVGLSISLIAATQNMESLSIAGMIVAGGPFAIVAMTELTKIPLAIMIFYSKWSKPLYILLALFISSITFETLFNGFERNFSVLNLQIEKKKNEIHQKHDQIEINKERIASLRLDMDKELGNIATKQAQAKKDLAKRIRVIHKNVNAKSGDLKLYQEQYKILKKELIDYQKSRMEKSKEWIAAKQELYNSLQKNNNDKVTDSMTEERRALRKRLDTLNIRMETELAEASFLTRSSIRDQYSKQIQNLEDKLQQMSLMSMEMATGDSVKQRMNNNERQISLLNDQYKMILDDMDNNISEKKTELTGIKRIINKTQTGLSKGLSSRIRSERTHTNKKLMNLDQKHDAIVVSFTSVKDKVQAIIDQNVAIKLMITQDKFALDELILSNQVYRMAAYIDDVERATDIQKSTVGMVASVWFGSLAFICAITGISMAFASLHLRLLARNYRRKEKEISDSEETGVL